MIQWLLRLSIHPDESLFPITVTIFFMNDECLRVSYGQFIAAVHKPKKHQDRWERTNGLGSQSDDQIGSSTGLFGDGHPPRFTRTIDGPQGLHGIAQANATNLSIGGL